MPTLDLRVFDDIEFKLIHLTAVMCWPSEEEAKARQHYILREYLGLAASEFNKIMSEEKPEAQTDASIHIGQWLGESIATYGGWPALANATIGPGQKSSPVSIVRDRARQGVVASWILKEVLISRSGIYGAAKKWAAEQIPKIKKLTKTSIPAGKKFSIQNERTIQNHLWPQFKDAAHLWAAFYDGKIKQGKAHRYLPLDNFKPINSFAKKGIAEGLKGFLDLSSFYLEEGRKHTPPTGPTVNDPTMSQITAWEILY